MVAKNYSASRHIKMYHKSKKDSGQYNKSRETKKLRGPLVSEELWSFLYKWVDFTNF